MTWKEFFDRKMLGFFITMALLVAILSQVSPPASLDGRFYYDALTANFFLQSLSPEALQNYRLAEFLDLFFIYNYTNVLARSLRKLYPESPLWVVALVPGLFDLIETGTIIAALSSPHRVLAISNLGYFTCLKWIAAAAVILWILIKLIKTSRSA